jgi:hypothetical protein
MNERECSFRKERRKVCKLEKAKNIEVVLQILVLVGGLFAFSYFMHEIEEAIVEVSAQEYTEVFPEEEFEVFGGFDWNSLGSLDMTCCTEMKNSMVCQDIPSDSCEKECSTECLPSDCNSVSECELGCCIDSSEGTCSPNSVKVNCDGKWEHDSGCNIPECSRGCCVLGKETVFATEKRCEKLSSFYGVRKDYRKAVTSEISCLLLAEEQETGACVIKSEDETKCRLTSKAECLGITKSSDNFYKDYLCSHPDLNTSCKKQYSTKCVQEDDAVYWFDSCGNRENIYDSDKEKSWNKGKILKKQESCRYSESNSNNPDCGNCNYFLGSRCGEYEEVKPEYGDYICRNLDCINAPDNGGKTKYRINGESWCVYDSYIGEGKDSVGSRHWRYYCIDGEVLVEGCGDFRTGLCIEEDVNGITNAACRPNRAMECIQYNSQGTEQEGDIFEEEVEEKCSENSDCQIIDLDFGKNYEFSTCVPQYPPGFDLKNNPEMAEKMCDQADFTCTKVRVKKLFGGWKCVSGCECDSLDFTQQMNDWCASLGDCGGYVNILGKTDKGYSVSNAPEIDLNQYKKYIDSVQEQYVKTGNFSELLSAAYGWGAGGLGGDYVPSDPSMIFGLGAGATGLLGSVLMLKTQVMVSGSIITGEPVLVSVPAFGAAGAAFGSVLLGASLGAAAGLMLAKVAGINDPSAIYILAGLGSLGGAALGAAYAISSGWMSLALSAAAFLWIGVAILAVVIIMAVVFSVMGIGDVKKTVVRFNCQVYQPPHGGDDCEKCSNELTEDGLKECSRYRCQSLGQTCEFLNQGTDEEMCVDVSPDDVSAPEITPLQDTISPGFEYKDISDRGFSIVKENGDCIPEFNPVLFGIKTNEPAQCRYDIIHTNNYEQMEFFFGDSNLFRYEHPMVLHMPSVDAILENFDTGELSESETEKIKSVIAQTTGDMNFFVRCTDRNGRSSLREYTIQTCISPGPDLTAPDFVKAEPGSGSYLKYNQTKNNLSVWISEPAECKWDFNDKIYENMNNNFSCKNNLEDADIYGWKCDSEINNLNQEENRIYIRCEDQPWLEGKETENETRNTNQESRIINLFSTQSFLEISEISPNKTIIAGGEPATITLNAKTSGGVDGEAECKYSFTGYDTMVRFFETFSSVHTQVFNLILKGRYDFYVECKDRAGNIARKKSGFNIEIDKKSPEITRVYKKAGNLYLQTNEDSECRYDFSDCYFDWNNSSVMSGIEKEHTTSWNQENIYYIKCRDIWENEPIGCSIIVKAEEI